jgi:uncharacterized protein (TIGR02231 family)
MEKLVRLTLVLCCVAATAAAVEIKAQGKIEAVTLYRGQAMVKRAVPVAAPAGPVELVVTGLPERIVPGSLYASAEGETQVRAVRYRTRAVGEVPRDEVRKLDAEIEAVQTEIRRLQSRRKILSKQSAYVASLHQFVAPTAKVEMTKGVLNAEELGKLTTFMFEQQQSLEDRSFEQQEAERQKQKELDLLQRRRATLTHGRSKTEREALVFLEKAGAGPATVRLNYLVTSATWSPVYNLHARNGAKEVKVEYSSLVQQMSGEDWSGVELTLSTASAALVADGVNLAPLWVSLVPKGKRRVAMAQLESNMRSAQSQLAQQNVGRNTIVGFEGQISAQWDMNKAANLFNDAELVSRGDQLRRFQKLVQKRASGLSVNYRIPGPVSVASRSDQQMVRIAEIGLPATFYNVANPLLTEYVYRQADLMNSSRTALLEGTASVYVDGEFVGKGTVPMTARGQKLIVGLGIDPQLRAWREFVSKTERVQGGNREITFKYRLVLDNYKADDVVVRAFDRVPHGDSNIQVTLDDTTQKALSTDKEYLRAFRPQGILRWDATVPKKSAAETAHIVEYSYRLAFDRNLDISATPVGMDEKKARQQFEMDFRLNR